MHSSHSIQTLRNLLASAKQAAAKADAFAAELDAAKAAAAAAEAQFLASLSDRDASRLAEAKRHVADLTAAVQAIENAGGATEFRRRALATPEVFDTLAAAFAERVDALNKLLPLARKKLAERRGALTEAGVSAVEIEWSPLVGAWRDHVDRITSAIADATHAKVFCERRGVNETPQTFDELFLRVTAPLPVAPMIAEAA